MSERSTWAEVSAGALEGNLRAAAEHAAVPVCAVVKANGYGHDLIIAARAFARAGAAMLGATRIEEARALREADVQTPVLILLPVPDPSAAVALGCEIAVGSIEEIAALPAGARAHLKVDTGMGRLGVQPDDAVAAASAIAERATLAGVWTHLADAPTPGAREQVQRFADVVAALRARDLDFVAHCANSAAVIKRPDARFDMVRMGTALYGMDPPGAKVPWPARPALTWYARLAAVRTLPEGATVGYGSEWRARRTARVGTLPVGYADGFTVEPHARTETPRETLRAVARSLAIGLRLRRSPRAVWFGERRAPVVGRVAMQATTVLLDELPGVGVGAVARIPGRRLLIHPSIERVEVDR